MTMHPPDPPGRGGTPEACSHPWLLVTCGECGAAIDELRKEPSEPDTGRVTEAESSSAEASQKLFIVARGHPELVAQLRAVMGDSESVQVIEDRRSTTRDPSSPAGHEVSVVRADRRRRALESDSAEKP